MLQYFKKEILHSVPESRTIHNCSLKVAIFINFWRTSPRCVTIKVTSCQIGKFYPLDVLPYKLKGSEPCSGFEESPDLGRDPSGIGLSTNDKGVLDEINRLRSLKFSSFFCRDGKVSK